MAEEPLLVITGPTASGKTALSLHVAERVRGEIISLDSRQVYRGMDIGTAKVSPGAMRGIAHFGLDVVSPDERYNAGRFAADARAWIAGIRGRGNVPVLVGGTGFFLRALTHPLFEEPDMPLERRERLKRYLEALPRAVLERWLDALDPAIRPVNGRQRVARAVEVALLSGQRLSWWQRAAAAKVEPLRTLTFVLSLPRDVLYARINARVEEMIRAGLVAEVESLLAAGYKAGDPGMNATGYPEIAAFLAGECSLEGAVVAIQNATRRYARRQLTWMRNQLPGALWLDGMRPVEELAEEVAERWREAI